MRWHQLFADLEGQLAAADAAELAAEVADRTRREVARTRVVDRARLAVGSAVTVGLAAAGTVEGRLADVGPDWLLVAAGGVECLVPASGISWISGLPRPALEPDAVGIVETRLTLAHALRAIARNRAPVAVLLRDGSTVTGTLDRVGTDYVDVAEHAPQEPRRPGAVTAARTVPFTAVAAVRSG